MEKATWPVNLHPGRTVYPNPETGGGGVTVYEKMLMDIYTRFLFDTSFSFENSEQVFEAARGKVNQFFDFCYNSEASNVE